MQTLLLLLQLILVSGVWTFQCDDGCSIPNEFEDDDWCDCSDCEDEPNWTCDTCLPGCVNSNCEAEQPCYEAAYDVTNWMASATYNCTDGCKISMYNVNDWYCDCSDCGDESQFNCTTCLSGCPEPNACTQDADGTVVADHGWAWCSQENGGFIVNDSVLYNMSLYGDDGVFSDDFLMDCKIGWQEGLVLGLDGLLLFISFFAVIYFIYKICKEDKNKLQLILKVLVTTCNIAYILCLAINIQKTYLTFMSQGCELSTKSYGWNTTRAIVYDITQITWRRMFIFAFIMVYITFGVRLENGLKNSIFESKKLNYYLRLSYILLIVVWVWGIVWELILYTPEYSETTITDSEEMRGGTLVVPMENEYVFDDLLLKSTTISLEMCCLFSFIGIILFIYEFKQIAVSIASQFSNGPGNQRGKFFESIISKTTLLGVLALASTLTVVIVEWCLVMQGGYYGYENVYTQEIFGVILSIDATMNIFCLNLNYDYSKWIYNKFNCGKLEKNGKLCVLGCTSNLGKIAQIASFTSTTSETKTETSNDD